MVVMLYVIGLFCMYFGVGLVVGELCVGVCGVVC